MKKTGLFLVAVAVALLGWEGYSLMSDTDDVLPITTVIAEANAFTGGLVGFVFGGLMGHFFFPRSHPQDRVEVSDLKGRINSLEREIEHYRQIGL